MVSIFQDRKVDNAIQTGKFGNRMVYAGLSLGYRF
jgi:hypothetical protein